MATRTYHCCWNATITVDDETVRAALLEFRVADAPDGPLEDDAAVNFELQETLLSATSTMPPEKVLQMYLVNRYVVPVAPRAKDHIEQALPGAEVEIHSIDVTPN